MKSQTMKRRRRRTVKMKQRAAMKQWAAMKSRRRRTVKMKMKQRPTQAGARVGGKIRIPNNGHWQRLETSTTSQKQAQAGRGR